MSTRHVWGCNPDEVPEDENGPILFDSFAYEQYVSVEEAERLYQELGEAIKKVKGAGE